MDERTKRVAQAICLREHGAIDENNNDLCKTCRNAHWDYDPVTKEDVQVVQPDGCLGLGYEYLAIVALEAADTTPS